MMPTANEDIEFHNVINRIKRRVINLNSGTVVFNNLKLDFINRFIESSFQFVLFKKEEVTEILEADEIDIYDEDDEDRVDEFKDVYFQALDDECIERFYYNITMEDITIMRNLCKIVHCNNEGDDDDIDEEITFNDQIKIILCGILDSEFLLEVHCSEKYFYVVEQMNNLK